MGPLRLYLLGIFCDRIKMLNKKVYESIEFILRIFSIFKIHVLLK